MIVPVKTGITNWLDIDIAPRYVSNWVKSSHDSNIGDLPIRIGIQLFRNGSNFLMPDVKLGLGVITPLGKYERLNPSKLKTDVTGVGSWLPTATLSTSKFWQIKTFHYVSARCGARYTVGTPVHVEGYNAYGGTATTKGYVYPGNLLSVFGAFEYNFSRNWAVACDALYVHRNRTKFTGKVADDPAAVNNMRAPSGEAFSLAPALEYNWSKNMGLICGAWFTVKGRNSAAFANALISFTVFI